MSFIGTIQTGPNANSYRLQAPGVITIPASGVLATGTPLRRNYLAIQGQHPSAYPYAGITPSLNIVGGDAVTVMASTAGGPIFGVYSGPTIVNSSTTAYTLVTPYITRAGVTPTLVGTASGGNAVTVGCVVGMNSLISSGLGVINNGAAAPTNFGTLLSAPASTIGANLGTVLGYPIVTALVSSVTAGTSVSAVIANTAGLGIGTTASPALTVNPGAANQEVITLSSVAPGTMTQCNVGFANASAGMTAMTVVIGNASTGAIPLIPGGIIGVTVACTTATTGANFATSVTAALNAAFSVYGAAPANIPGIGGIAPFGIVTAATSVMSITAAVPSPLYNAVPISVGTGTSTMTYPASLAATSSGAYPACFGTFANNHNANEPIVGTVVTSGATLTPVPQPGGANVVLALVDLNGIL